MKRRIKFRQREFKSPPVEMKFSDIEIPKKKMVKITNTKTIKNKIKTESVYLDISYIKSFNRMFQRDLNEMRERQLLNKEQNIHFLEMFGYEVIVTENGKTRIQSSIPKEELVDRIKNFQY